MVNFIFDSNVREATIFTMICTGASWIYIVWIHFCPNIIIAILNYEQNETHLAMISPFYPPLLPKEVYFRKPEMPH